jgi:hypothetical protein
MAPVQPPTKAVQPAYKKFSAIGKKELPLADKSAIHYHACCIKYERKLDISGT